MSVYNYTKVVASDRLEKEIRSSSIITALDYISATDNRVSIYFKAELSGGEVTTLDALVTAHVATSLPENASIPTAVVSTPPFADPTYRTKRDKTANLVTIAPSASTDIDYLITEERYVHGGGVVYDGAELGDYVTACIYDKDAVIPAPYRAALCENWPMVASYIIGEWVPKGNGRYEINTYPLNAKITPGLYLRINYNACNAGSDRKVGVNYYLAKKL